MNVLSLFDGMSCGQIALRELGIHVDSYYASEIDKFAIAQTLHVFPNTIELGDVRNVRAADLPHIDLIKLEDGVYDIRKLSVAECKRLQTIPDWYEFITSDNQAYKMLGNGWTVEVIKHILNYLKHE